MKQILLLIALTFASLSQAANTKIPATMIKGAAGYFGSAKSALTGNCIWTSTSTTYANFAVDADCPVPVVTGQITAPATKVPGFIIPAGSPVGTYLILVKGFIYNNAVAVRASVRLHDGTSATNEASVFSSSANGTIGSSSFTYVRSSSASAVTIQMQIQIASGTFTIDNQTEGLSFEVYYYPALSL